MATTMRHTLWRYDYLPSVQFQMEGGFSMEEYDEDESKRSHFDQEFNWRIDEDSDEFVIRIRRKPDAAQHGHTNVAVKIEGGLSEQPDGSVVFDGGVGNGAGNKVSTFGLSFKISHESSSEGVESEEESSEEEPEEREVTFFDHSEHKLLLAPENYYKDMPGAYCDACMVPMQSTKWLYRCPNAECDYCVHAACAQFPRTIRHPCHSKHTLKLLKLSRTASKVCDVCKVSIRHGLHYHCAKCDFDVHPACPAEGESDPAPHPSASGQQYLDQQTQLLQQQTRMQAVYLQSAMMMSAGRSLANLAG